MEWKVFSSLLQKNPLVVKRTCILLNSRAARRSIRHVFQTPPPPPRYNIIRARVFNLYSRIGSFIVVYLQRLCESTSRARAQHWQTKGKDIIIV